jgi:integrase
MAPRRRKPGDPGTCVPKKKELICVFVKRQGGRTPVHRHFGADQMREANRLFKKVQAEEAARLKAKARPSSFEERALQYCENYRGKDRQSPASALKRAYPIIGEDKITDIDLSRLLRLQAVLFDEHKFNTADLTMGYVKRVIRVAVADGLLATDPTVNLKNPPRDTLDPNGRVDENQVPSHEEAYAILNGTPLRWRFAVYLGFGCGLRIGEVLGIAPMQVDLKAGTLNINIQQQRRGRVGPKTRNSVRTIELPDRVMNELRRAMKGHNNLTKPLATGPRGGTPRREVFYEKAWHPALKAAGLPEDAFNFHAARHYCVSAMLERGVPLTAVAAYVGDTVETINRVYAHWLRGAPAVAKVALDQALAPPPEEAEDELAKEDE